MKNKKAIVTFELVDESLGVDDYKISREIPDWFLNDAISFPWTKKVKEIVVRDS